MSGSTIGWFAVFVVWVSAGAAVWCAAKAESWRGKYENSCLDLHDLEEQLTEAKERLHRSEHD